MQVMARLHDVQCRADDEVSAAFAAELRARSVSDASAAEAAAAQAFDGQALLDLLRQKYARSYDVSLVSRTYMGRQFVALNIMWKYAEQKGFGLTPEEHLARLEYCAAALRAWGVVSSVKTQLAAAKDRPRVGKAVSLMLDVPAEKVAEWIR